MAEACSCEFMLDHRVHNPDCSGKPEAAGIALAGALQANATLQSFTLQVFALLP